MIGIDGGLLAEAATHAAEHSGILGRVIEHAKEWKAIALELSGGFLAYFVHTIHHKLFHIAGRLLPKAWRGGH